MKNLSPKYNVEIDRVCKNEWDAIIQLFSDATLYQTWSYGAVRWGQNNLSHIVLKRNGKIVSAAQTRIVKLPILRCGIAYVTWGPMWQLNGKEKVIENLCQMIRVLLEEYVIYRKLFLRVIPNEIENNNDVIFSVFEAEGFRRKPSSYYRTLLLDLSQPMESLRMGLRQNWRNHLKKSEKNGLRLVEGTDDILFNKCGVIFKEMQGRKRFISGFDINEFRTIQNSLPNALKMKIILCEHKGELVSACVFSAIGDKGITLFRATNKKGLKMKGSYLSYWRIIQLLKDSACHYWDQGGINPKKNPGVYHFKAGLGGIDVHHIGQFDVWQGYINFILVKVGDIVIKIISTLKYMLNKLC